MPMENELLITEKELLMKVVEAAGSQVSLSEFKVVYALKMGLLQEENYALAFHPKQGVMWALNIGTGYLREIQIKNIRYIKEQPSCYYRIIYRRSLKRDLFFIPYLSEGGAGGRFRCVQMETGQQFHAFCKALAWRPLADRIKKKLTRQQCVPF